MPNLFFNFAVAVGAGRARGPELPRGWNARGARSSQHMYNDNMTQ